MKHFKRIFLVTLISMVCSLFVVMNVQSQSLTDRGFDKAYYEQLKAVYLEHAQEVMEAHSCMNSGMTFDYKYDDNGQMHYRLKVHHRRFETMDYRELQEIYAQLKAITFMDGQAMPVIEFV